MPTGPWGTRLPVSNNPLPGESLASYLLNLAHRLDLTPADLLIRTGIKPSGRVGLLDLSYATTLPTAVAEQMGKATGLTIDQTTATTLDSFGPVLDMARPGKRLARSNFGNKWINPGQTRLCPACLVTPPPDTPANPEDADHPDHPDHPTAANVGTGNTGAPRRRPVEVRTPRRTASSEHPQDANTHHVWQTTWITPWALACTRHRTVLLDQCPTCNTAIGSPGQHQFRSLIPNVAHPVHHPAACRALIDKRLCNNRLDQAHTTAATTDLLNLQQALDTAMSNPHGTHLVLGHPVAANQWLRDLRLAGLLLTLTGAHKTTEDQPREGHPRRTQTVSTAPRSRTWEEVRSLAKQPPLSVAASANLLLAAQELLSGAVTPREINQLHHAARTAAPRTWDAVKNRSGPSVPLAEALHRDRFNMRQPARLSVYLPKTPELTGRHIPAYLPTDLFSRHLSHMRSPSTHNDQRSAYERQLRRYAAIAMVMHVDNVDMTTAGHRLGYTQFLSAAACARASTAVRQYGGEPELFARIGDALIDLASQPPVDYKRRRDHFDADWRITDDAWQTLQLSLPRHNRPWHLRRATYSAWIWTLVTQGDPLMTPIPIERPDRAAGLAHDHQRWGQPTLKYLDRLARVIAGSIDQSGNAPTHAPPQVPNSAEPMTESTLTN